MAKIFSYTDNRSKITEDANFNVGYETEVKTYRIKKRNNNFIVERLERKTNKSVVVARVKKTKNRKTFSDVERDINNKSVKINSSYVDQIENSNTSFIQSNHKLRVGRKTNLNSPQIIANFICSIGDKQGTYVGYSERIKQLPIFQNHIDNAIDECREMAIRKFIFDIGLIDQSIFEDYNKAFNYYDDVDTELLEWRFLYVKRKFKN